jgi:hypothetical protein
MDAVLQGMSVSRATPSVRLWGLGSGGNVWQLGMAAEDLFEASGSPCSLGTPVLFSLAPPLSLVLCRWTWELSKGC